MTLLRETPLSPWHRSKGARIASFAGWDMPIQYEGIVAEHLHTRAAASVFDICHMGEFLVHGSGARQQLEQAVSHRLDDLVPGKCRYGFLLNPQGGILDDLIVYCLETDSYMLVVNAARASGDLATLSNRLSAPVAIEDVSSSTGKIDLQGPLSIDVLETLLRMDFRNLGYFSFHSLTVAGTKLLVSRTGYTGELGYEIYLSWDKTLALWEKLIADKRVRPAGLGSRDTLRLEAGLPLYGHELDEAHTPAEAGMDKLLTSLAQYVGREGALRVRERLIPLSIAGRRSARAGDIVALPDGRQVGRVTSGSFAPSLGNAIALAWVDKVHADADSFVVHAAKAELPAQKTRLPFHKQGTARKKLI